MGGPAHKRFSSSLNKFDARSAISAFLLVQLTKAVARIERHSSRFSRLIGELCGDASEFRARADEAPGEIWAGMLGTIANPDGRCECLVQRFDKALS